MSELGELTVRLSMESGNMSSQIKRLKGEMQTLDAGFQAAASQAGGFGSAMDAAAARANMLQGKLNAANGIVERQKRVWDAAKASLEGAKARYEETGRKLEENRQKHQALEDEIARLKAAMAEEAAANGDNSESYIEMSMKLDELMGKKKELAQETTQLEAAEKRQEQAIASQVAKVQQAETAYSKARTAANQLAAEVDNANQRLKNHVEQLEAAGKRLGEYGEAAKKTGQSQQRAGQAISNSIVAQAGTAAVQAAIAWEDSWAGVTRVLGDVGDEVEDGIAQSLLDMSKQGPVAAGELAAIAQSAAQLGVETGNIVQFTDTVAKLAATTDLTSDAAATALAQYTNITGRNKDAIDRLGSMTLALGSSMATTESEIVGFATAIAAAGKQADMTDQEIFAISATLASLGLTSQAGGTSFSKLIANMQVAAETGGESLEKFADIADMSADEFARAFKEDAAGAFQMFIGKLNDPTKSESAIAMLNEIGITEARMRDMILRASNATGLLGDAMKTANTAFSENTKLTDAANIKYGTTANRMKTLGNQATAAGIAFGESMLPALKDGMDFVSTLIEKFSSLDESTRKTIVQWGLFAAGIGPAITVLGKANAAIGSVSQGLGSFMTSIASNGGGLTGLLSSLGGLLGPAGIAAAGIAAVAAAGYFIDMASGAKEAREAIERLNGTAKDWSETQAKTLYDTGGGDPFARFNVSKADFGKSTIAEDSKAWIDELIAVWTDGEKETDEIVSQFAQGFSGQSDKVRDLISQKKDLMEGYEVLSPEQQAKMDADMEQLDEWDREISDLLKKRQNGLLTDEEKERLQEITTARAQLEVEYSLIEGDGYDKIITRMQAEIERLKASGGSDETLFGDALNALAQGRQEYNDALNESYAEEYAKIQLIDDEIARQEALNKLNEDYNAKREEGEEAYQKSVLEAGKAAFEGGGYEEQLTQLNKLTAELGNLENVDPVAIENIIKDMDEGKLASMIALVEQLKEAGATEDDLKELGIPEDLFKQIEAIRDIAKDTEGLGGLAEMFGEALPEEVGRIMVSLDMTQAAEDWAAFAEGGSLTGLKAKLNTEEIDLTSPYTLTGTVTGYVEGNAVTVDLSTLDALSGTVTVYDEDGNASTVKLGAIKDLTGEVTAYGEGEGVTMSLSSLTGLSGQVTAYTEGGDRVTADLSTLDALTGTVTVYDEAGNASTVNLSSLTGLTGTVTGYDESGGGVTFDASTLDALDGTVTGYSEGEGVTFDAKKLKALDGTVTTLTVASGTEVSGDIFAHAGVILNPLDKAAIAAWEAGHKDTELTGPAARIPVGLGAGWETKLQDALDEGMLTITTADGVDVPVTPKAVPQITANDLVLLGDDGTVHVVITPEVGTPAGVEAAGSAMSDKGPLADVPILGGMASSTQEDVEMISNLSRSLEELAAQKAAAMENGDADLIPMIDSMMIENANQLKQNMEGLSGVDLTNIATEAANLMQALADPDLDPSVAEEYRARLQEIAALVANADEYLGAGNNVSAGIAQGMLRYGWTGDASTLAASITSAINNSLGAHSPATATIPTGRDVSEGIAKGMTGFSFAAAASQVKTGVTGALDDLEKSGQSIGGDFDNGIASGITDGKSKVIAAARKVALEAAREAKRILEIKSPSRVGKEIGGFYTEGIAIGIEDGQRRLVEATKRTLAPLTREDGPQGVLADRAGWMDGSANQANLAALRALSGDIRKLQGQRQAEVIDVEALAEANAQRPVVLQVGDRELARATMGSTRDAQNEYAKRIAFAYGK